MHVPFPLSYFFFPYLSVLLLSPGPVWHHWEAYTVWPGLGGEVCEVCEGEDRDWTELRQTTEAGLHYFYCILYFSSVVHFKILGMAACSCLHGCMWLFLKCLCGLVINTGQNLTCLWIAPSCLVLAAACSPSSSMMASVCRPTSGGVLSLAGEERKWEQTNRMWSEGVWKETF